MTGHVTAGRLLLLATVLGLTLMSAGCATHRSHAPSDTSSDILGRWAVAFPDWGFETVLEFAADSAGSTTATILGPAGGVRLERARLGSGTIEARAHAGGRTLVVRARALGDSLTGRWHVDHLIYRFFGKGEFDGVRVSPSELAPLAGNTAAFDSLWSVIDRLYYDPELNGEDWATHGERARAIVAHARTDAEALTAIEATLDVLESSHLYLAATPTVRPARGSGQEGEANDRDRSSRHQSSVHWGWLSAGIGHLQIRDFRDESEAARIALDSAFAALGSADGLILDLRGNPGGSVPLADRLADHLIDRPLEIGHFVARKGLEARGLRSIDELDGQSLPRLEVGDSVRAESFFNVVDGLGGAATLVAGGGIDDPYHGRVVVLVDRGTASTAEAVAAALQETGRVVLIGERTAGAMLAARPIEIATGWTLTLPLTDYRTTRGARIEGVGVEPAILVDSAEGGGGSRDPALERAVEFLVPSER